MSQSAKDPTKTKYQVAGLTAAVGIFAIWIRAKKKNKKEIPLDTVVMYQIPRGSHVPSPIPFAMKLETYLRMAQIPYQLDHSITVSNKGKLPWIEYNGTTVADSEFCIQYLNKVLNINLNKHLTKEQRGVGRAFQKMLEENLYWAFALDRMVYDSTGETYDAWLVPRLLRWVIRRSAMKAAIAQGMGRHSLEEIKSISRSDLQAVSDFLGTKDFLFGDSPCQYDCAVFGLLSELRWRPPGGFLGEIMREYENLCKYCDRMKDTFWPDWNDCITHGGTRRATK